MANTLHPCECGCGCTRTTTNLAQCNVCWDVCWDRTDLYPDLADEDTCADPEMHPGRPCML
jgi:hypothetical protein